MRSGLKWLAYCTRTSVAIVLLCTNRVQGADTPWLSLEGHSGCFSTHADALAQRILERTTGTPNTLLSIQVEYLKDGPNQSAEIRLYQGAWRLGTKRLTAPTCEELVDGVVTVSALALSIFSERSGEPDIDSRRAAPAMRTDPKASGIAPEHSSLAVHPGVSSNAPRRVPRRSVDQGPTADPSRFQASRWRALAAAGVDFGTADIANPLLGAGPSVALGNAELRALAWYGLPSFREEDTTRLESTRFDFAAATLDYCRGLDNERWVALCGGLEGRFARWRRVLQAPDQPRKDKTSIDSNLALILGTTFAYRATAWEPQLALSLHVPLLSTAAVAHQLAFRALFAAAYHF